MRYTNRDCWAALICLAAQEREQGIDRGVALFAGRGWRDELRDFMDTLGVPVRHWPQTNETQSAYGLDERAGCYGGGVRPVLYRDGSSGHSTPRWWSASAGLGPGATNRETFVLITRGVADALRELNERVA